MLVEGSIDVDGDVSVGGEAWNSAAANTPGVRLGGKAALTLMLAFATVSGHTTAQVGGDITGFRMLWRSLRRPRTLPRPRRRLLASRSKA